MDSLLLPPLYKIVHLEGKGNYSVRKYYSFPFSYFYRHKLEMLVRMMETGRIYRKVLDFGAGEPQIFSKELRKHALTVHCADTREEINVFNRYDLIVCASILEFVYLPTTIPVLKMVLNSKGTILVASPMDTWLSRLYFKLIGDETYRASHKEIMGFVERYFKVIEYRTWLGLYFCCKAVAK